MEKKDFDEFLDYWPEWADLKFIRIIHTHKSKHKRNGLINIYIDKNKNAYEIKLDKLDVHNLSKTIREVLNISSYQEYYNLKMGPKQLWKFLTFILEKSDTTHLFGLIWGGKTKVYEVAFIGSLTDN